MPGEGHKPYEFAGGLIYLDVDQTRMMLMRVEGTYEPAKTAQVLRCTMPGMTFIDIGSCMGDYALMAAKAVGDTGQVLAFEPGPQNAYWIRKSIELNDYRNIRLFEFPLSDADGEATFYMAKVPGAHTFNPMVKEKMEAVTVQKRSLDSVLAEIGCSGVDIIKIDAEGAEIDVLRGASQTLAANRRMMLLIDIHPKIGVDPHELCSILTDQGFSLRWPENPDQEIEEVPDMLREVFALRS